MSKTNKQFLVFLNVLTDWALILCAYLLASWLWLDVLGGSTDNMAYIDSLRSGAGLAACLYALVQVIILAVFRLYRLERSHRLTKEFYLILGANVLGVFGIGAALYLFRLQEFSRGVLGVFLCLSVLFTTLKHALYRHIVDRMFRKGYFHKNVLLIGSGALAAQYDQNVRGEDDPRIQVVGYLGDGENAAIAVPRLGALSALGDQLQGSVIDEVVIALEPEEIAQLRPVIALCDKCGTRASVIPFYNDMIPSSPQIEVVGSSKLVNLRSNQLDNLGFALLKRLCDILVSAILLLLLSPLFLVVVIGIKLSSPGPVFFKQQRVGLNKKPFTMYKFRSMRVNAAQDTAWTTDNDARKTRFGSFIRKCSIDELPQLYNVLIGDMSLVGPRPELPYYVERFKEDIPLYMVKHQVRPGMTGWAQVNGYRGDTSIEKRVEHDIYYIEHLSIGLDLKILWLTLLGGWLNKEQVVGGVTPDTPDKG